MTKPKDPKEKSIHRKDIKFGVRVGLAEDGGDDTEDEAPE